MFQIDKKPQRTIQVSGTRIRTDLGPTLERVLSESGLSQSSLVRQLLEKFLDGQKKLYDGGGDDK